MLNLVIFFLLVVVWSGRKVKGPLWALAISWILALAPIGAGVVVFDYRDDFDASFAFLTIGYLAFYVAGFAFFYFVSATKSQNSEAYLNSQESISRFDAGRIASTAWWVGLIGVAFLIVDFGADIRSNVSDLASLREYYVGRQTTVFGQLASVLTWGCLYSFVFALVQGRKLSTGNYLKMLFPVAGYFLISVFSAGRQAAFQIALFAVLAMWVQTPREKSLQSGQSELRGMQAASRNNMVTFALALAMAAYMGYVAIARDDALYSYGRVEVLQQFFNFEIDPTFDSLISFFGNGFRTTVMETIIYFSGSTALFSQFLKFDYPHLTLGVMSFPLIFRQLEPLTGLIVIDVLNTKIALMKSTGALGTGWTTGISSYIMDFGRLGSCAYLALQGYYSAFTWRRALATREFNDQLIAIIMIICAIYLPFQVGSSDSNLLMLWIFCSAYQIRILWRERKWSTKYGAHNSAF